MTLTAPERVWMGKTGAVYHIANDTLSVERARFWAGVRDRLRPETVLEVGCGTGLNLVQFHPSQGVRLRAGADVSRFALQRLRRLRRGDAVQASAGRLPFRDRAFDLVVTAGCLIHVPADALGGVLDELHRVAKRDLVLCEYDDGGSHVLPDAARGPEAGTGEREIPWRGHRDVLWARPYGFLLWRRHVDLGLLERRELTPREGWDRTTLCHLRREAPRAG